MRRIAWLLVVLWACTGDDGGTGGVTADDCTEDEVFATQCSECGMVDECIDPVDVCAPACENEGEMCDDGGLCLDGACLQNVCG